MSDVITYVLELASVEGSSDDISGVEDENVVSGSVAVVGWMLVRTVE